MNKTRLVCLFLGLFLVCSAFLAMPVQAGVGVKPAALSFGSISVNTTSPAATVVVTNNGGQSVSILQVSSSLSEFVVISPAMPVALGPHDSASFQVVFQPDAARTFTGSIVFSSSRTNGVTQSIAVSGTGTTVPPASLSGNGVQPQISVIPGSTTFGNVTVGLTNTQMFTINNPGTANLSVTQALLTGTGFSLSGLALPLSVAPGSSSTFTISFTPTSASSLSGSLALVNNTVNSALVVALAGSGVSPVAKLAVSPAALSFGSITTGTTGTQAVTLANTGNSSVSVSQISVSGTGFSASGLALPVTLAAGQSTTFGVTFAPTSAGNLSGSVTVSSNASNSLLAISLSGSGAVPVSHSTTLSWVPGSSSYAGFNVYRGSVSGGPYIKVNSALLSATSFIDASVGSGQTYYYVATELDSTGAESPYSSEVSATLP